MVDNKVTSSEIFSEIYNIIVEAKGKAWRQVNKTLISLYWTIGEFVSKKVASEGWGKNTVANLSSYILSKDPMLQGFSARNIWRMKQFYEIYKDREKLSTLLTEISWSNHLHLLSKTSSMEEKEFYLILAAKHHYPARDFSHLIDSGTFERTVMADQKLSTLLTEFPTNAKGIFKDTYVFDFLNIMEDHKEIDLKRGLLNQLKKFLLEMGPDFSLIKEEFLVQVGNKDFKIDLLLHHRELNCLVALECKISEFKPEHLGQLQFYLEALDRDVKKPHENPSIGILICKEKDEEVVKYALSRTLSPALVSKYETKLINKSLLQAKLQEIRTALETDIPDTDNTESTD